MADLSERIPTFSVFSHFERAGAGSVPAEIRFSRTAGVSTAQAPLPDVPTEVPEILRSRRTRCAAESRENILLKTKLYVGNLPFTTSEAELRTLFEQHGTVDRVDVITDRETGRPRGFAFVEMANDTGAAAAARSLNGYSVGGRALRVDEAADRGGDARGARR